jgi:alpha-N-arabinofuranosidase
MSPARQGGSKSASAGGKLHAGKLCGGLEKTRLHINLIGSRVGSQFMRAFEVPPTYETKQYGTVPLVDATATQDPATGQVSLFAVNRSEAEPVTLEVDLRALPALDAAKAVVLSDPDLSATNSQDHPDRVQPRSLAVHMDGSVLRLELPAVSWSCIRLSRRS